MTHMIDLNHNVFSFMDNPHIFLVNFVSMKVNPFMVNNTYSIFTITANILRYYTNRLYHKIDIKTVLQHKLQHRMSLIKLTR